MTHPRAHAFSEIDAATMDAPAGAGARRSTIQLALLAAAFCALTAAGVWLAVSRAGVRLGAVAELFARSPRGLAAAGALGGLVYAADAYRYRVLGSGLGVAISWAACFEASLANFLFAWLTPGSGFGAPAAIYVMGRRGVPIGAGVLVTFGKSITGMAFLLVGVLAVCAGAVGPVFQESRLLRLLAGALACYGLALLAAVATALLPARAVRGLVAFERRVRRDAGGPSRARQAARSLSREARRTRRRLRRMLGTPRAVLALLAGHTAFYATFVGVAAALGAAYGMPWREGYGRGLVYTAVTYLSPTPGGAGISEALAQQFFSPPLAPAAAIAVGLGYRAITFYAQLVVGAGYFLGRGVLRDVMAGAATRAALRAPAEDPSLPDTRS